MKIPRYIEYSLCSAHERGFEYLDKLAAHSSKYHLLRHMLDKLEDMDMSSLKWGMFILRY